MPKRASDRTSWIFPTSADFRNEAEKWEQIAADAEADGDLYWAADAKREAAALRQKAREHKADGL